MSTTEVSDMSICNKFLECPTLLKFFGDKNNLKKENLKSKIEELLKIYNSNSFGSCSLLEWQKELERARDLVWEEPAQEEPFLLDAKMEKKLTSHRNDEDFVKKCMEMMRNQDGLMDLSTMEIKENKMSMEESTEEEDPRNVDFGSSIAEWKNWLEDLKRKCQLYDTELVEEKHVCSDIQCLSIIMQFWSALFEHVKSENNSRKFLSDLDSLRNLKRKLEKKYKIVEEAIIEVTKGLDVIPDSDHPVVMVTRKKKSELEEKHEDFNEHLMEFNRKISDHLNYNVRYVNEKELFVGIQGSWIVKFIFDESASRNGVIEVVAIESNLQSWLRGAIHEILGEHHRIKKESTLEHLLHDYLPSEFIQSQVKDVTSIMKMLDILSSQHLEASNIVKFMERINPLQLDDVCHHLGDVLTFSFLEPSSSLSFSVSTSNFKLPSLYSSSPKWVINKHCGSLREAELKLAISSVKLSDRYFESVYNSIVDWLRRFPYVG